VTIGDVRNHPIHPEDPTPVSPRARLHSPIGRRAAAIVILGSLLLAMLAVPGSAAAASYRDCSGLTPAAGADLHRCDLTAATLIGQDLHGINLAKARLVGINAGCDPDLPRTNLAGAWIYRANLTGALLCDAILDGADLHRSNLTDASLEDATLPGANLARADLDGSTAGFAVFRDASLARVTWRHGGATGAIFENADLHRADLRWTVFNAAEFTGANLRYARLNGADLSRADLTGARLGHATGLSSVIWSDTTCPDGTNSDANGGTCLGHLG
jgi:uncharacterized protein YjbI with pentapeptide repeats